MKKVMLAIAIVFLSINFTSCTLDDEVFVEQNEEATQGEQEVIDTDPNEGN